tara:strand:+ start:677 stop:1312 length:636 start_codon:yes stop_codon:yes gene_type:complete
MNLIKIFTLFLSNFAFSQPMMGSQHDEHNCISDGGYSWCESTSSCVRPWVTPCPNVVAETHQTEYCQSSSMQLCRMMCPTPKCNANQCAMRQGSCCNYKCQNNNVLGGNTIQIPENCISWFDGCNTCSVVNGKIGGCTMMMCFRHGTPKCRQYNNNLKLNNICYQFCEDNSQPMINKRNDCPSGTTCSSTQLNQISFDTCGDRALRCVSGN